MQKTNSLNLRSLYTIGGVAAILQLVTILTYAVLTGLLGPKPTSAEEYFAIHQISKVEAFFRGDFLLLILIGLYLGTFPALYVALRHLSPVYVSLATLFTILAVAGTFSTESSFSLLYLGKQYSLASSEVVRTQLKAAGEAVIASDMWNSSGAYMGGILLQGSGVMMSIIMRRSKHFSKITAYSGLLGNGFDLIQHVIFPLAPSISVSIKTFMGLFYLIWFPLLGRDFLLLAKNNSN